MDWIVEIYKHKNHIKFINKYKSYNVQYRNTNNCCRTTFELLLSINSKYYFKKL